MSGKSTGNSADFSPTRTHTVYTRRYLIHRYKRIYIYISFVLNPFGCEMSSYIRTNSVSDHRLPVTSENLIWAMSHGRVYIHGCVCVCVWRDMEDQLYIYTHMHVYTIADRVRRQTGVVVTGRV